MASGCLQLGDCTVERCDCDGSGMHPLPMRRFASNDDLPPDPDGAPLAPWELEALAELENESPLQEAQ
jgi:hypothetical protein